MDASDWRRSDRCLGDWFISRRSLRGKRSAGRRLNQRTGGNETMYLNFESDEPVGRSVHGSETSVIESGNPAERSLQCWSAEMDTRLCSRQGTPVGRKCAGNERPTWHSGTEVNAFSCVGWRWIDRRSGARCRDRPVSRCSVLHHSADRECARANRCGGRVGSDAHGSCPYDRYSGDSSHSGCECRQRIIPPV